MNTQTISEKPQISIGLLGQDGHGKTSLTNAIVRILSYRNINVVEGSAGKISIGDCHELEPLPFMYETTSRRYALVDCQSHIDVVKNLILNRIPLHGAILVVSAVDGVTAQTKEQIRLARAVGIPAIVVFLNMGDLASDSELVGVVQLEVQSLLMQFGYPANTPVIQGSATAAVDNIGTSQSELWIGAIQRLLDAIDETIPVPPNIEDMPFLMRIEDAFTITGRGTVVTGMCERGTPRINMPGELVGLGPSRAVIATDLEHFGPRHIIQAGQSAGVLLRDINRFDVQRGQVVAEPGSIHAHSSFRGVVYVPTRLEGGIDQMILSSKTLTFVIHSAEIWGKLQVAEGTGPVSGGDVITCTLELESSVAIERGTRFNIRQNRTRIGVGVVTEPL